MTKDAVLVNAHKYYYPNGKVRVDEFYKHGKLNGYRTTYYSNSNIEQVCCFVNGVENGWCSNYDIQGNLISKSFFINGKQMGDTYFYYRNGRPEQYLLLGYKQNKERVIFYNESGMPEGSIGGTLFIDTIYNNRADIISDTIQIGILISHPPKTKTSIKIVEYDSLGKEIKVNFLDSSKQYIHFASRINKGLSSMKIIAEQYDSLTIHTRKEIREIDF